MSYDVGVCVSGNCCLGRSLLRDERREFIGLVEKWDESYGVLSLSSPQKEGAVFIC